MGFFDRTTDYPLSTISVCGIDAKFSVCGKQYRQGAATMNRYSKGFIRRKIVSSHCNVSQSTDVVGRTKLYHIVVVRLNHVSGSAQEHLCLGRASTRCSINGSIPLWLCSKSRQKTSTVEVRTSIKAGSSNEIPVLRQSGRFPGCLPNFGM